MTAVLKRSFPEVLAAVLAFDLSDVKRAYAKRHRLTNDIVEAHERELKRYLTLCIAYPGKCLGMFSEMDNLWHEFLCHTPKYEEFCYGIGGRYLHHIPVSSDAAQNIVDSGPSPRQQTIEAYEKHFGLMDPIVWNMANPDACSNGDCCSICTSDKKYMPTYPGSIEVVC